MPTLAYLKSKIATDLHRTDCSTVISDAVTGAIRHYNRNRWWFNEGRAETTTTSSVAFYPVPSELKKYDNLLVTISGSKEELRLVSYDEMDDMDDGRSFGQPTEVSPYEDSLRLYPVPDGAYVITLSYHKELDAPSESGSNAWTTAMFDLIRFRSEWDVSKHYLRNKELAIDFKESELETLSKLNSENVFRVGSGMNRKAFW